LPARCAVTYIAPAAFHPTHTLPPPPPPPPQNLTHPTQALVYFASHFLPLAQTLSERAGVTTLHLATDTSSPTALRMLYTLTPGISATPHYGLALASVVPLPQGVLQTATHVARELQRMQERRGQGVEGEGDDVVKVARRRRLVLELREKLVQARGGALRGGDLGAWLGALGRGFVVRMGEIEGAIEGEDGVQGGFLGVEDLQGGSGSGSGRVRGVGSRMATADGSGDMLRTPC